MDELVGKKFSSCQYFIHFEGKSGELCKLTPHTINKLNDHCQRWVNLDGEQRQIAANVSEHVQRWTLHSEELREEIETVRYHKECYIRFCDKTKVERAEKRMEKMEKIASQGEPSTNTQSEGTSEDRSPVPLVRVSPQVKEKCDSEGIQRRNKHILPEQCIICKKQDSYIKDKALTNKSVSEVPEERILKSDAEI